VPAESSALGIPMLPRCCFQTHLRENGWKGQVRTFRKLRGEALIIFSESLSAIREPQLMLCSGFLHACRTTIFADKSGEVRVYTRVALFRHLPKLFFSGFLDFLVLLSSWALCEFFARWQDPKEFGGRRPGRSISVPIPF